MDGLSRMKWRDWLTLIFIVPFVAAKKLYQRGRILIKTITLLLLIVFPCVLWAKECPNFTAKQDALIHQALSNKTAKLFDIEYLVASILVKESFVGRYIVKIRPENHGRMSAGVMHTLLSFVARYEGVTNSWEAKQNLLPKLINDDEYSINMGINFLVGYVHLGKEAMLYKYNPSKLYVEDVLFIESLLMRCY